MSLTSTLPGHARPTSISSALEEAVALLERAGVVSPRVDAELLLGHILDLSRGAVQAKAFMDAELSGADASRFSELTLRRAAREPLQHITGKAPFRSLELSIGPGAFVPRPETEQVAQFAIDALRAVPIETPLGVDLGTGSGAIALAMASEVPHARIWGVENSPEAFIWARRNQVETGADNATIVFIDLADALPELNGTVDVVHAVSATALRLLHAGGTLVMEHGELQAAAIAALLRADGWNAVATHRDLLGRDRATTAVR